MRWNQLVLLSLLVGLIVAQATGEAWALRRRRTELFA